MSLALLAVAQLARAQAPTPGAPLPPWREGMMDIHQISTGRGNAALIVMPDGTSMLVDAGASPDGLPQTDVHPDNSRPAAEWLARYVARHLPDAARGLDYVVLSHFHADHFGGFTTVARALPVHRVIDRGYPGYDYPGPLKDSAVMAYRNFTAAARGTGLTVERFIVGSGGQLALQRSPSAYPHFVVRNVVGNGEGWTGTGDASRPIFRPLSTLAPADLPNENMCSLGIRISYGPFSYFTGGDLPGAADPGFPAWHAVEPLIAGIVGHVDAHAVNQHGAIGQESEPFMAALASTVLVIPAWSPTHPAPDVMKRVVNSRLAPTPRFVFTTDERDATRIVLAQRANAFAAPPGHVIIRVEPSGREYWVIVVTNSDESDRVVAVKGPFASTSVIH